MRVLVVSKERVVRHYISIISFGIIIGFLLFYLLFASDYKFKFNDEDSLYGYLETPIGYLENKKHYSENKSIADELYKKVRVLCWVMTCPKNHEKRARHVKATWGKRCNVLLFMSSMKDDSLPTVALPVGEGRNNLWAKTKEAFRYVYKHHRNDADWFLKADDDTYVIMENLRFMLLQYQPSEPLFFGCRLKAYLKQGYMSGGAGYVLSSESVRRFVTDAIPNKTFCVESNTGSEDVEITKCLDGVGVQLVDTRDSFGRSRFFPLNPDWHAIPIRENNNFWFWQSLYYRLKQGMEGCSDIAISFHYVSPKKMYVLEYLIYNLRPIGIIYQVDIKWPINIAVNVSFIKSYMI